MKGNLTTLIGVTSLLATSWIPGVLPPLAKEPQVDPSLTQEVTADEKFAPAGEKVAISAGHVDMGATVTNSFELLARDDTGEEPIWRHLDDVVFVVGDAGKLSVPDDPNYDFTKAHGTAWVVPQHEIPGVVWLGWNTQQPKLVTEAPGGVDLIFEGHQGPGVLTTFVEAGNFSAPQVIWDSTVANSQVVHIEPSTHTHVSWVFTEPGEHLVRVTAQATVNGEFVSDTQILRFAVGSQADIARVQEMTWSGDPVNRNSEVKQAHTHGKAGHGHSHKQLSNGIALSIGIGIGIAALIIGIAALVMRRINKSRKEEALS